MRVYELLKLLTYYRFVKQIREQLWNKDREELEHFDMYETERDGLVIRIKINPVEETEIYDGDLQTAFVSNNSKEEINSRQIKKRNHPANLEIEYKEFAQLMPVPIKQKKEDIKTQIDHLIAEHIEHEQLIGYTLTESNKKQKKNEKQNYKILFEFSKYF